MHAMKDYLIGLYEKALPNNISWKDKLEIAKRCGFDYLEISIDESDWRLERLNDDSEERAEIINASRTSSIPIRSMCLSAHRKYPFGAADPETAKKSLRIMEAALQFASILGVRTIQLAGYDVYYEKSTEQTRKQFEKNLVIAAKLAAKFGVNLAFETMETPFMNTVQKALAYVKLVDSPYLQIYPDIGNVTNAFEKQKDVEDDLLSGKGHILAAHIKETKKGIFREVPFNEGHVKFQRDLEVLWDIGVRRFVIECWYDQKEDYQQTLFKVNGQMRRYIEMRSDK